MIDWFVLRYELGFSRPQIFYHGNQIEIRKEERKFKSSTAFRKQGKTKKEKKEEKKGRKEKKIRRNRPPSQLDNGCGAVRIGIS